MVEKKTDEIYFGFEMEGCLFLEEMEDIKGLMKFIFKNIYDEKISIVNNYLLKEIIKYRKKNNINYFSELNGKKKEIIEIMEKEVTFNEPILQKYIKGDEKKYFNMDGDDREVIKELEEYIIKEMDENMKDIVKFIWGKYETDDSDLIPYDGVYVRPIKNYNTLMVIYVIEKIKEKWGLEITEMVDEIDYNTWKFTDDFSVKTSKKKNVEIPIEIIAPLTKFKDSKKIFNESRYFFEYFINYDNINSTHIHISCDGIMNDEKGKIITLYLILLFFCFEDALDLFVHKNRIDNEYAMSNYRINGKEQCDDEVKSILRRYKNIIKDYDFKTNYFNFYLVEKINYKKPCRNCFMNSLLIKKCIMSIKKERMHFEFRKYHGLNTVEDLESFEKYFCLIKNILLFAIKMFDDFDLNESQKTEKPEKEYKEKLNQFLSKNEDRLLFNKKTIYNILIKSPIDKYNILSDYLNKYIGDCGTPKMFEKDNITTSEIFNCKK